MREKTNIIEINGKRYDAVTGERLTPAGAAHHHVSHSHASADKAVHKSAHKPSLPAKPAIKHAARQPARHVPAHPPVHSHTLMRQAVKKPAPSSRHITAQGSTDSLSKLPAALTLSRSIGQIDEKRLRRAKAVPKSRLISRFPQITADSFQPTPIMPPVARANPEVFQTSKRIEQPAAHTTKRPKTTSELLENALQQAVSHQEKPVKPARHDRAKRHLAIGGTTTLALLVFGIIFTQNLPNVRLQMASAKVGFDASLPGYRPSGYSLGQLSYSDGAVAAHFNSNSDSRRYTITQERSSWNNAMLLNNFVAPTDSNYQTEHVNGLTIYLYGNRNATWLKDGLWYVIQSNGSLSDRQLIELATSL